MWDDYFYMIDIKKWIKTYYVKKNNLRSTLLIHLAEVWHDKSIAELNEVANQIEAEVKVVMKWN